jgi:putative ABC transport system substrate-binding protein
MIDRRTFLAGTSAVLLAAPLATEGQQAGRVYTVGLVSVGTDPARPVQWQPFLDAMRELGYVEGKNLAIQTAFGNGRTERLPALVSTHACLLFAQRA